MAELETDSELLKRIIRNQESQRDLASDLKSNVAVLLKDNAASEQRHGSTQTMLGVLDKRTDAIENQVGRMADAAVVTQSKVVGIEDVVKDYVEKKERVGDAIVRLGRVEGDVVSLKETRTYATAAWYTGRKFLMFMGTLVGGALMLAGALAGKWFLESVLPLLQR